MTPNEQILDLMGRVNVGFLAGPWLKACLFVPHVFQIGLVSATGQVYVVKTRGQRTIPRVPTYSIQDCQSVR